MFGINYENLKKFHVSLGIFLMVAAFIITLTTLIETHNYVERIAINLIDDIRENIRLRLEINEKSQSYALNEYEKMIEFQRNYSITQSINDQETLKVLKTSYILLYLMGAFFFLIGYIPWICTACKKTDRRK